MNNEKIAESGFLPEFVVLGMLKAQGFKKVADDLITWGASLSKCESYEDFCKLNTLSLKILQDAEIDPPVLVELDEDKQIVSLLAYSRTSSLFEKLEGLVTEHGEKFHKTVSLPELEKTISNLFNSMGMQCKVLSTSSKEFDEIEKQLGDIEKQLGEIEAPVVKEKKITKAVKAISEADELNSSNSRLNISECRNNNNFIKIEDHYFDKNFICKLYGKGSILSVSYADKEISFETNDPERDILKITKLLQSIEEY